MNCDEYMISKLSMLTASRLKHSPPSQPAVSRAPVGTAPNVLVGKEKDK